MSTELGATMLAAELRCGLGWVEDMISVEGYRWKGWNRFQRPVPRKVMVGSVNQHCALIMF
jgi:hypothetical protein